jgi:hypothetical protein
MTRGCAARADAPSRRPRATPPASSPRRPPCLCGPAPARSPAQSTWRKAFDAWRIGLLILRAEADRPARAGWAALAPPDEAEAASSRSAPLQPLGVTTSIDAAEAAQALTRTDAESIEAGAADGAISDAEDDNESASAETDAETGAEAGTATPGAAEAGAAETGAAETGPAAATGAAETAFGATSTTRPATST